jgi:hypothetical protein
VEILLGVEMISATVQSAECRVQKTGREIAVDAFSASPLFSRIDIRTRAEISLLFFMSKSSFHRGKRSREVVPGNYHQSHHRFEVMILQCRAAVAASIPITA